jgi:cell division protein FtsZ
VLLRAVEGIIDLIHSPGLINLDFADVRSVMKDAGPALIGLGRGSGEHRAADAARHAIASPLLEASFEGARGILFNVAGPADLRLAEVREAADEIGKHADPAANIIFGASFSESLGEDVLVTLMATGLNGHERAVAAGPVAPEAKRPAKRPSRSAKRTPSAVAAIAPKKVSSERSAPAPETPGFDDDDFEIPSFLRRPRRGATPASTA